MTATADEATASAIPTKPYDRCCEECGARFKVRPCEVRKALARGNQPPRFCSLACRSKSYKGAGNPKWRGGTMRTPNGYIYQYAPNHPHTTKHGYVMQHRLVMEKALGRYLSPTEEVHHRNHVRDDNRIENLELMSSKAEHRNQHAYYEQAECGTCGKPMTRSIAHRRRWKRTFCSRLCAAAAGSTANTVAATMRGTK